MDVVALSLFYLVLVSVVAARRARGTTLTFLDMCLVYAPDVAWLGPLACLLPLSLGRGSVGALGLNAVTAGVVLFTLMNLQLGPRRRLHPPARTLRVATFNVYGGCIDIRRCVAFLERAEADVIFLQEAWWTNPHRRVETLPVILGPFEGWHVFRSTDEHELMVLSRHPLSDLVETRVANRPCLIATAHTPAGDVRLINVHLDPPATPRQLRRSGKRLIDFLLDTEHARRLQGDALRRVVASSEAPTVVAGDFNSPPHAYARRVLRPLLRDVFSAAGRGFGYTFPQRMPMWRIDYILVSRDITPQRCDVPRVEGSDHLPLVADLRLP